MITRIVVSTVTLSFFATIGLSQMKYSRPNSQKPTPTPTPTPAGQQRILPAATQIPARQSPTPPQRTTQAAIQPRPAAMTAQNQPKQIASARTATAAVQQKALPTPMPTVAKPTPTPVPPPDVKAYLDRQVASSKDQKFHFGANGKDLALTPFHVWRQKSTGPDSTSTCVDMRGEDGRIYDIDFVTTGAQVTGVRIHKINGEALR